MSNQSQGQSAQAKASGNDAGSGKDAGKSQQADKLEGLIADLDFSDVPEEIRDKVIKATAEKVRQYDKGFRAKTEDLSGKEKALRETEEKLSSLKVIQKELQDDPKLAKAVNDVYYKYKSGRFVEGEEAEKGIKTLDKLIKESDDPSVREQLRTMRQAIKEEASGDNEKVTALDGKTKKLEDEVNALKDVLLMVRSEKIDSGIDELNNRFGKDIVSRYEDKIRESAMKYPHQSIEKLFLHHADIKDVKTAFLAEEKQKEKKEIERKKQGAWTSSDESLTTKIEPVKDKAGRIDVKDWVGKFMQKHNIKAP